jgi:hypothetical protein
MSKIITTDIERTEGTFVIFAIGLLGFGFRLAIERGLLVISLNFPKVLG